MQPSNPHERRLRRMLTLATGAAALLECRCTVYYGYRGQWLVAASILVAAAITTTSFFLARQRHVAPAKYLLLGTTFVVIFFTTAFLDVPSA